MGAGTCCCSSICRISKDDWDGNGLYTFESANLINSVTPSAPTGATSLTKTDSITGSVTGATNASPIVITSSGHGLSTGDQVTITSVGGNTASNGQWVITVLSSSTFSLTGSTGNGSYTSGGTWKAFDGTTLDFRNYPLLGGVTQIVSNQSNSLEINTAFNWTQGISANQNVKYVFGQIYPDLVLNPTGQNYKYWGEIDFAVRYLNKVYDSSATPTTVTDYTYNVGDSIAGITNVSINLAMKQGSSIFFRQFGSTYREGIGGTVFTPGGGGLPATLKIGKWCRIGSNTTIENSFNGLLDSTYLYIPDNTKWTYADLTNASTGTWPKLDWCYGAAPIYFGWALSLSGVQHTSGGTYRSDRSIAQKIRIDRICINTIEDTTPACPCFDVCFQTTFAGGVKTYFATESTTTTASFAVPSSGSFISVHVVSSSWLNGITQDYVRVTDGTTTFVGYAEWNGSSTTMKITNTTAGSFATMGSGATVTGLSNESVASFTNWMFSHSTVNSSTDPASPLTQFTVSGLPGAFCMFGSIASGRVLFVHKDTKYAAALFDCNAVTTGGIEQWLSYECSNFDQTGGSFTRSATSNSADTDVRTSLTDTFPSSLTITAIRCDGTTPPGGETGAGSCVGGANYTSSFISGTWRWINSSASCSAGCVAPAALTSSFISTYGNPTGSGQTFITDCIPYINHAPQGVNKTISTPTANHTFTSSEFSFSDPNDWPQANFLAVKVAALPLYGILTLDVVSGGTTTTTTVVVNQYIKKTDIDASRFKFVAGSAHVATTSATLDVWKFQVQDDGGTAHDGVDTDTTQRNFSLGVRVNHAPVGTSSTIAIGHNTPYTFAIADFGFTDPNDSPPDSFYEFHIIAAPSHGTLTFYGTTMNSGDAQLTTGVGLGALVYTPTTGYSGTDTITFKVQDDGGTANSGNDTDTTARTWTLNVS